MRILQISSARTFGGGERHVADLCRGLMESGHDIFVAIRPTCEWRERLDFLPEKNIFHVSIRNSFGVLSAIKIADFIRNKGIEVVHAHVARDYIPTSIACLAAKRPKFVITRHVLFPLKPFNRLALKNLSRAIGVSEAVGRELKGIFPPEKVAVIPNGIDFENYRIGDASALRNDFRVTHSIPPDAPLVGTLGELKSLKGQRDFVLAAAEVAKQIPDCRFVVVGKDNSYDKSFRRELKRLARVMEMEDRFLWLDWLEDTAPLFSAIDVFVSPSHSESFGLAILEAMAHEKAIVATGTAGAVQLLGESGDYVPVGDVVAMAGQIVEMLHNNERRAAEGKRARVRAMEKFELGRMIDLTEALYSEITASGGRDDGSFGNRLWASGTSANI